MAKRQRDDAGPVPKLRKVGNYGYVVNASRIQKLVGTYEWASKLQRVIQYYPPPSADIATPMVGEFFGATANEANTLAAEAAEAWIRANLPQ